MVDMGTAVIVGSMLSMVGMIVITQLWQMNWFKRENFKIQKSNVMAQNKIKLDQLRKELGVKKDAPGAGGGLEQLAPFLKMLKPEQLTDLAEMYLGGEEIPESEDGITALLDKIPEPIKEKLLGAASKYLTGEQEEELQYLGG